MPIYMKYGDIKGDVTAEGHKGSDGWVEVGSFQFGIGRGISMATGGGEDREASAPSISEIVVTKTTDSSSYRWMEAALWGEGVDCTVDFCKTDKDKLEVYQSYDLQNCMVSGFSVSSGGDRPSESISISFSKIIYKFIPMDSKNTGASPMTVGYDIASGKGS